MADPTFKWPDAGSPTVTLTFDRGEFVPNSQKNREFIGETMRSINGVPFKTSLGDMRRRVQFSATLPKTQVASEATIDDYISFIETTLKNGIKKFTYTNRDGEALVVKIAEGNESISLDYSSEAFAVIEIEMEVL